MIDRAIEAAFRKVRLGFYHAIVSSSADEHRRHAADAEWGPNVPRLRRIASPILDVIPAIGTRMAVLSQDGVPEFGALIGQVWDDLGTPNAMTAWLRANLQTHPGHLELGVQPLGSISIRIGANSGEVSPVGAGKMYIGTDAVEILTELSNALQKLQDTCFALGAATATPTIIGSSPLSNAPQFISIGIQVASIKALVDLVKP